ncbi:hypothetical protein Glove_441g2 [Diversispora epigaea]|uniref:C2H2-type domain-containing protein n=1 Tax=Diversispora epigaea TaxID=1348612 RepID=A0A397GVP6_9GLOM|nr:hypothetical protein Glove_441g2 [Diversispora epigaea]
MPSTTLSLSRCSTCGKEYKNSKGLARYKYYVQQYNQHQQELDELPINTINEFKQIIVTEIHRKLTPSFRNMGKKTLTIPCTEIGEKDIFSKSSNLYSVRRPNSMEQNQSIEEIDPLEKLLQSSIKKKIIKRRPRFLRGEILIEWKKKTFKEINGNINKAGYLHINFYISQSQIF